MSEKRIHEGEHCFEGVIYETGINWAVDVPPGVTRRMKPNKGYIYISGQINDFPFKTTLIPVRNGPYRLFVNRIMLDGGETAIGRPARFCIRETEKEPQPLLHMHPVLGDKLREHNLLAAFGNLTEARQQDVLRYLYKVKSQDTLFNNINTLLAQLRDGRKDVRIPWKNYESSRP